MAQLEMTQIKQENLLSRWSRRKQQSTIETQSEDLLFKSQQQNLLKVDLGLEEKETAVVLTDDDMPPIISLNEDSDFSGFMSSGVSDELRNLALKKLFQAPSFNFRDGLDEYDEDYTSFEKLGDIVTCDMKHQVEMEAKKKLREEADKLSNEAESEPSTELTGEEDIENNNQHEAQLLSSEITTDHRHDDSETPLSITAQADE